MKPVVIIFHITTDRRIDIADQICAASNVSRIIRRWPLVMFFAMLNVGRVNSHVISSDQLERLRRVRLKWLSHELMIEWDDDQVTQAQQKSVTGLSILKILKQ